MSEPPSPLDVLAGMSAGAVVGTVVALWIVWLVIRRKR